MTDQTPEQTAGVASEKQQTAQPKLRRRSVLADVTQTLAIALVLAILIKTFLVQAFYIPSPSMENTINVGDRIMVSLLAPGPLEISRGDIVVFKDPGGWLEPVPDPQRGPVVQTVVNVLTWLGLLPQDSGEHLVKRVIGLPGDTVECCSAAGELLVNGVSITEPYLADPNWYATSSRPEDTFSVTVPQNTIWVMGDNRMNSLDSRHHRSNLFGGAVPLYDVVGVAFLRSWPLSDIEVLRNPEPFSRTCQIRDMAPSKDHVPSKDHMALSKDHAPSLRLESELFAAGATLVAGMDEVGRGAIAGPVSVGVVVVDATVTVVPQGLRDSKLLSPVAREKLYETCRGFGVACSVGHATPAEIDQVGIMGALRRAGNRALAALGVHPDVVLLDGKHDWLTARTLFDSEGYGGSVVTRVKADQLCASVAAASVLAKVTRDGYMVELAKQFPEFGWASNKGYACAEHLTALAKSGPTGHHRRSWRLPECGENVG